MNIFEKRPLCLILCIGLCGFLFFSFENTGLRIAILSISVLLGIFSFIFKKKPGTKLLMRMSALAILLSSILSYIYFDRYFKAYEIYDEEICVVGTVEKLSPSSSYSTRLLVDAEEINGKRNSSYHFYAYVNKADAVGVIEGTRISFKATLTGFSEESYSYNIANSINAYASDVYDIKILEHTKGNLSVRFDRMREYVTRYIIKLSDSDSGAILSALILGQRDYLPDQLRLDFRRIGISHILALSGMHLAILSLAIEKLLLLLKINKKWRVAITSVFVFLYMGLTGFSVSVVRAGIMVILSSILFLLSKSKDSLTSLSVAVLIICLISPNAILDVSLWLSALATFGIIAFSEITSTFKPAESRKQKILRYIYFGLLASVFAISATTAVSMASFGGFSILAPFTTIIFSILAEGIMYLGCAMLLVGWLIPLGWILSPLCRLMSLLAGAFSSLKFAYVSSNFAFVSLIILLYTICFYLFMILKLKKPIRAMNIIVILYALISLIPTVMTTVANHKETVVYNSDYRCDEMLIRSKNEVCLINSAQYSKNLAYTSLDLLEENNVTYLDKYYITHYSWSIDDEIKVLTYNIAVDKIYIPEPRNSDEETILKIVKKAVQNGRTEIVVFREYETVTVGEYYINLLYSEPYGETSVNAFALTRGDEVYTYISSGLLVGKNADIFYKYISLTDHLILGDHGKKYKEKIYLDQCYADLDSIVIHSENVYLKQENMQYFIDRGCEIYTHPDESVYYKK